MTQDSQVLQITTFLNKHWKLRCEFVGKQSIDDLVAAVEKGYPPDAIFRRVEGGVDFDMQHALEVLVQAATLVKTAIEVYKLIHSKLGRKPTRAELDERLRSTDIVNRVKDQAVLQKWAAIVEDLING